jgi:hypothetical protein
MYIKDKYQVEKIHSNVLKDTILNSSKYFSHLIQPFFIEYQKEFHKNSIFEDCTLKIKTENNNIIIPMTIEVKDKVKELNFYNYPIIVHCTQKINNSDNNIISNNLIFFANQHKISKCKILFKKIKKLDESMINNFFLISKKVFLDLTKSKEQIFKNFKPNLRNELRKDYGSKHLKYRIVDHLNYKDEIINMKELHKKIVGFQTRSDNSWFINEKMILNRQAFLIEVSLGDQKISYSMFQISQTTCNYFSSCTNRDMFKVYRNINHKSMWYAIQYAINKTKYFFIGDVKISSKELLSEKEKSIGFFFSRFGEPTYNYYYSDNLNYMDFT